MIDLELQFLSTVEKTALACSALMGRGDSMSADKAATEAMRQELNTLPIDGKIVIGEGERDKAPMLFIGEKVGRGGTRLDIAVDPLEGTTILSKGLPNAIAVLAASKENGLLHAPDIYMDKLIVSSQAKDEIDLDWTVEENIKAIAKAMKRKVTDLTIIVLDRERHNNLIQEIRDTGARIKLIGDGDITAAIAVGVRGTGVHAVYGIGGAPEGVIAAAALKCLGGNIQGRFWPRNDKEVNRAKKMGITDINKKLTIDDLAAADDVLFAASGITSGDLLRGVSFFENGARTHSIIMSSTTKKIRFVDSIHITGKEPLTEIRL